VKYFCVPLEHCPSTRMRIVYLLVALAHCSLLATSNVMGKEGQRQEGKGFFSWIQSAVGLNSNPQNDKKSKDQTADSKTSTSTAISDEKKPLQTTIVIPQAHIELIKKFMARMFPKNWFYGKEGLKDIPLLHSAEIADLNLYFRDELEFLFYIDQKRDGNNAPAEVETGKQESNGGLAHVDPEDTVDETVAKTKTVFETAVLAAVEAFTKLKFETTMPMMGKHDSFDSKNWGKSALGKKDSTEKILRSKLAVLQRIVFALTLVRKRKHEIDLSKTENLKALTGKPVLQVALALLRRATGITPSIPVAVYQWTLRTEAVENFGLAESLLLLEGLAAHTSIPELMDAKIKIAREIYTEMVSKPTLAKREPKLPAFYTDLTVDLARTPLKRFVGIIEKLMKYALQVTDDKGKGQSGHFQPKQADADLQTKRKKQLFNMCPDNK
jgi:hypothetical protein